MQVIANQKTNEISHAGVMSTVAVISLQVVTRHHQACQMTFNYLEMSKAVL